MTRYKPHDAAFRKLQRPVFASILLLLVFIVAAAVALAHPASSITSTSSVLATTPQVRGDNERRGKVLGTDEVDRLLENARSYYRRGLSAIEHRDTVQATRIFESAVQELNQLASTPDIDKNEEFTGLAQQVIEDFESYIQSIDNLGENSPTFVLREKIFKDVESKRLAAKNAAAGQTTPAVMSTGLITTIPLTQNEHVSRCIDYLTAEKGRKFFSKWIERTGKWFPMLKRIAREENMPEEIIHLAMVESALNPRAVSRASAVGMWQFMQSTGEIYKLTVTPWKDDRRDPERATRAAMRHLRDLYNDLDDWHLALAAYNCGAGGVKRAIKASGIDHPNFWDIRPYLPRETRDYVPMFIATTLITMQHEAYGFVPSQLNYEPEYKIDTLTVQEPVALSVLASCAGISCDSLKCLNTDLLSYSTPPSDIHVVKLPYGSKETVREKLSLLPAEERLPWVLHEVQRGETLAGIAAKYEAPIRALETANEGVRRSKVRPGSVVRIPRQAIHTFRPSEAPELYAEDTKENDNAVVDTTTMMSATVSVPTQTTQNNEAKAPAATGVVPAASEFTPHVRIVHTCKAGETLYRIASSYGVALSDLRSWNGLSASAGVRVGQRLVVIDPAQQPSGETASAPVAVEPVEASQASVVSIAPGPVEGTTPPKRSGAAKTAVEKKDRTIARKATGKGVIHRVARGETLAQIADNYNTTIQAIRSANRLSSRRSIQLGQRLKIPLSAENVAQVRETFEEAPESASWTRYKVRRGDNLGVIAGEFGVREQQIRKWNPRVARSGLQQGQVLRIFAPVTAKGSSAAPSKNVNAVPKYYKAKRGDTMAKIARKYGIPIRRLLALNNSRQSVRSGQRIRLL